jgi:hypothetical protein
MFLMDVVKVDWDVAYVAMTIRILQAYVPNVSVVSQTYVAKVFI